MFTFSDCLTAILVVIALIELILKITNNKK